MERNRNFLFICPLFLFLNFLDEVFRQMRSPSTLFITSFGFFLLCHYFPLEKEKLYLTLLVESYPINSSQQDPLSFHSQPLFQAQISHFFYFLFLRSIEAPKKKKHSSAYNAFFPNLFYTIFLLLDLWTPLTYYHLNQKKKRKNFIQIEESTC